MSKGVILSWSLSTVMPRPPAIVLINSPVLFVLECSTVDTEMDCQQLFGLEQLELARASKHVVDFALDWEIELEVPFGVRPRVNQHVALLVAFGHDPDEHYDGILAEFNFDDVEIFADEIWQLEFFVMQAIFLPGYDIRCELVFDQGASHPIDKRSVGHP